MPAKGYRKPKDLRRDDQLLIRLSAAERKALTIGAKRAGRPLAAWIRETALTEAERLGVAVRPKQANTNKPPKR